MEDQAISQFTGDEVEALSVAMRLLEATERRDVGMAIGLMLMLATFAFLRARASALFPKEFTATILLGSSVLAGLGGALVAGVPPARAALAFLACSSTAIAFWEGVARHVVQWWRRRRLLRRVFTRKFPMG